MERQLEYYKLYIRCLLKAKNDAEHEWLVPKIETIILIIKNDLRQLNENDLKWAKIFLSGKLDKI